MSLPNPFGILFPGGSLILKVRCTVAKDPAVLFYTSDFLAGTMTMSHEHTGMYIKLLCLQHQKGRLSEKDMLFICSTYVEDVYSKFKKDKKGMYFNARLENESLKRKSYSESRRKNISHRYDNTSKKKDGATYVEHMENENENINVVNMFNKIYVRYPKKIGKKEAFRHFKASVKTGEDLKKINLALDNYLGSERVANKYIQNASTWFNNWSDWVDYKEDPGSGPANKEKAEFVDFKALKVTVEARLGKIATEDMIKACMKGMPDKAWWIVDDFLKRRYPGSNGSQFSKIEAQLIRERRSNASV